MRKIDATDDRETNHDAKRRRLSPQAERALAEASERRRPANEAPRELGGRGGLDPVRYGDWEVGGIATDF